MYAYDETRNLIEIRGRGVKIITLLLDHNLSYEDNTYYYYYLLWKAALLDIKYRCSNLHWQDCPFIMYPSLQMQLYEPLVLVQLALESHTWLSSLHSSI